MSELVIDHSKDGESKEALIISILSVFTTITTLLVGLRIYTRAVILKGLGWDDTLLIVAQIIGIGSSVVVGLEKYYGLGKHIWLIPAQHKKNYGLTFWISMIVYNAALILVKISIVLMYRRIFVTRVMRIVTLVSLVFLIAWAFAMEFSLAFICVPASKFWEDPMSKFCKPMLPTFLAVSSINMITDFFIFLLPLPSIKTLQLPLRQKLILAFILCLGLFTCIVSIIRLQSLPAAARAADSSWDNTEAALWSIIELSTAVIAACLPTLGPLVSRFFPRFMNLSSGRGGSYPHSGSDGRGTNKSGGSGLRSRNLGDGGLTPAELANRRNNEKKGSFSPEDSTEELYATNNNNGRANNNNQHNAEIGLSDLKFHHAITTTKSPHHHHHHHPEDSDSTNSDQYPIHGVVQNAYGKDGHRVPATTVTTVAAVAGGGGGHRLKKLGNGLSNNNGIVATTVIKQEWREHQ